MSVTPFDIASVFVAGFTSAVAIWDFLNRQYALGVVKIIAIGMIATGFVMRYI